MNRFALVTTKVTIVSFLCLGAFAALADEPKDKGLHIEAQPLSSALREFSEQTGLQVGYASELANGKSTDGVEGIDDPKLALNTLLAQSGLKHTFVNDQTVVIQAAPSSDDEAAVPGNSLTTPGQRLIAQASRTNQVPPTSRVSQEDAADRPQQRNPSMDEIIVTAQRRKESIQDVPMSMSAITHQAMKRQGFQSREDFLRLVPSVNSIEQGAGRNIIVIRGAYGEPFSTGPTVGVYLGEAPLTGLALGNTADVRLVDMERVEVLRGPQGTLYGSNSLSGTIRYVPNAPDPGQYEVSLSSGYSITGHYGGDNTVLEGVVNIPLVTDELAIRASAYRHFNSGFIKNTAGDDPVLQTAAAAFGAQDLAGGRGIVGDTTATGGRIALFWQPTDQLSFDLSHVLQELHQDDRPFAQRGYGDNRRSTYDMRPTLGDVDMMQVDLDATNLTINYDFPFGSLLSSTSHVQQDALRNWEIGTFFQVAGHAPPMPQTSLTKAELFAQEIRFVSSFQGPYQLIAGAYYEDSVQPTDQADFYSGSPAENPIAPGVAGEVYANYVDRDIQQVAAFGEASFELFDRVTLTLGGRAFEYDARFVTDRNRTANPVTRPLTFSTTSTSESGSIMRAGIEIDTTDAFMVYANYSEGFRLGQPISTDLIRSVCDLDNDGFLDGTDVPSTFDLIPSDRLSTYELGTRGSLWSGRASFSVAAYRNEWTDIPVVFRPPGCTATTTISGGEASANGVEFEGSFVLTDRIRLDVAAGHVDTQLENTTTLGPSGAALNYVPELNAKLGAEYSFSIFGRESWVRADYTYFDEYYTGIGRTGTRFDSYDVVGAAAGIEIENVRIRAFIRNLTDTYAITSESTFPANGVYVLAPRTVGVQVDISF